MSEGQPIPAGSALTDITKQTVLPEWYSNYAMDVLANQRTASALPFQEYVDKSGKPIPRVADFAPDQQAGFQATRDGAFSFRPELGMASSKTQDVFGRSSLNAAQPYFGQAAGMSGLNTAQPYFNQATSMSGVTAAEPRLQQGAGYVAGSTGPLGIQMAEPYLGQAAQTSVQNIGQYMNPYTEQVVNRIGALGARTLQEQLLPAISDQMTAAGQFGGTRQAELTGRAIRDTMEGISAQQAQALQQGYTSSAGLAQADLQRQAQLAQTAGGLGGAQQQALLGAGAQMADIGQAYGALTQAQQQLLADVGKSSGALTQGQQQLLADIGRSTGQLYGQDTQAQLSAAQQLAGMAQQRQQQELTGAGALQQVGAQQQGLAQKNLDVAREDFLARQAYPQQNIDAMTRTMQGVASGVPTATQEYGIQPAGYRPENSPSTASTIAAGLTGGAALVDAITKAVG
jgi:hypothetical protein